MREEDIKFELGNYFVLEEKRLGNIIHLVLKNCITHSVVIGTFETDNSKERAIEYCRRKNKEKQQ